MNLWLDAQLSPLIAKWINDQGLRVSATPLRDIGLLKASDREIFQKARMSGAIGQAEAAVHAGVEQGWLHRVMP